jgi:hypothetical protein
LSRSLALGVSSVQPAVWAVVTNPPVTETEMATGPTTVTAETTTTATAATRRKKKQEEQNDEQDEAFDFPPGANENGIVKETVVAGGRQFLEETGRYRLTQTHELDYSDAPREQMDITYDVEEGIIHERLSVRSVEIDRWITPDRTVAQSVDTDIDRTGRWRTETVDPVRDSNGAFTSYPLKKTTLPALLASASFEFDRIVTEAEQPYARYAGEITGSERLELRQRETARVDYRIESVSDGNVSMLLAESGAIRSVEYEFTAEVTRRTRNGRETIEIGTSGEINLAQDEELDAVTEPKWIDSSESVREFGFTETSLGRTYKLASGPPLPGSVKLEYSQFYLTAQFGEDKYIARYTPRTEFDTSSGVVASLKNGELEMDWKSMSGRDAFEEADRLEMSVYLYTPDEGRTIVFHEERYQ